MAKRAAVYRSMASLHRAGVGWPDAIASAASGVPGFAEARRRVEQGASLAEAFEGVVDPLDQALLEAGERNGTLERTLERMADAHEERARRRTEAGVRLLYPRLMVHACAVLMALPDLIEGRPLAALGWAALPLVPFWAWTLFAARVSRRDRPEAHGRPPEPPPLVGELRSRVEDADARALEALGHLYEAGVPLGAAARLAARAGWGGRAALDLFDAVARVERGDDLSGAFVRLPPDLAQRLRAAETSGSLGTTLLAAGEELRYAADVRRRRTGQVVPVVLILLLGLLVLARLVAFYGDYFSRIGRLAGP